MVHPHGCGLEASVPHMWASPLDCGMAPALHDLASKSHTISSAHSVR